MKSARAPINFKARPLERRLLLRTVPLALGGAVLLASLENNFGRALPHALLYTGIIMAGCWILHLLFLLDGFDGDEVILPALTCLFLLAGIYQADLPGNPDRVWTSLHYQRGIWLAQFLIGAVILLGKRWKEIRHWIPEFLVRNCPNPRLKEWLQRVSQYESGLLQVAAVAGLVVLLLLLKLKGIKTQGDALVTVPLPFGQSFTPSEPIRLLIAVFLADYLARRGKETEASGRIWPFNLIDIPAKRVIVTAVGLAAIYALFFLVFRDLGPAAVVLFLSLLALYVASGRWLAPLVISSSLIGLCIVGLTVMRLGHLNRRVEMWLDPWDTRSMFGDHLARALWSISAGGWWGAGPGSHNLASRIPLAANDSAFAGISATFGFFVAAALLGLFAAVTRRGLIIARSASRERSVLLAFTLTALLAVQAIWICGALVRIFPLTGINVPFISTGLSSMAISALGVAFLLNLSRSDHRTTSQTENPEPIRRRIGRLSPLLLGAYLLPAAGVIYHGCPWLGGDATFNRTASAIGGDGKKSSFENPYLVRFRSNFERGRIFSADQRLLAVSHPGEEEMKEIREMNPGLARAAEADPNSGRRFYPLASAAAQLVGWTTGGRFHSGAGSIETEWDSSLRGYQPGELAQIFRQRHNPIRRRPRPQDLRLTIYSDYQSYASSRLAEAVSATGARGGAAVVYDINTGEVLCAVTAPSFSPNQLSPSSMALLIERNARTGILTNKPLSRNARYYPGSAFKIFTAGAALDAGVEMSSVCRSGANAAPVSWEYGGKRYEKAAGRIHDYGSGSHGSLQFPQDAPGALAASCNVYFARLATTLGVDRFHAAMERAGLTGTPEADKLAPYLPQAGFGQITVQSSPLELTMLSAAAGAAVPDQPETAAARPHWVAAIVTEKGESAPPQAAGSPDREPYRPFSHETALALRRMMLGVVESPAGTAHSAFYRSGYPLLPGISTGGKTGTAEFEKRAGGRTSIGRHAWFTGFARNDYQPQPRSIAFTVLLEDVRSGLTGGTAAAPVARDLIRFLLPPQEIEEEEEEAGESSEPVSPQREIDRFFRERWRGPGGPLGPAIEKLKELFKL